MPRPREHDPERVLQSVMEAFWVAGYDGTSFSDLEAATGLDRAQLSRLYGNKRDLFLLSLQRAMELRYESTLRPLAESGDLAQIKRTLLAIASLAESDDVLTGCLVCNTCREEIATSDPRVAEQIHLHFERVEGALASALRNSVANGSLTMSSKELRRSARLLYGVMVSLLVLVRAGESHAVLREIALQAADSVEQLYSNGR